jgi:hypothetical protein
MDRNQIILGLVSLALSGAAVASASPIIANVGAGLGFSALSSHTQDINVGVGVDNRYISNKTQRFSYLLTVGLALRHQLNNDVSVDYGLNAYGIDFGDLTGIVKPAYSLNPNYDILNYQYKIKPSILLLAQATFKWNKNWTSWHLNPYLMLGAGMSHNSVANYSESTPSGGSAAPMVNPYRDDTSNAFAFSIGFGVSHVFGSHRLTVGYQYVYAGHAYFKAPLTKSSQMQLETPTLQGHYLSVNYNFSV